MPDLNEQNFIGNLFLSGIDNTLYKIGSFLWKLSGPEAEVQRVNDMRLSGLEAEYPGIRSYFTNLIEFSEFAPIWSKQ